MHPRLPLILLVVLWLVSGPLFAAESLPDWPRRDELLPASARIVQGRLENGMRYAIYPLTKATGQVSLRLLVDAGSLQERDEERGYAHFVEHMAFNGTRHFPSGELVKALQREGVGFGPHVNAHTFIRQTSYEIDLTQNTPERLALGLRILRDFSDGILFEPREVKRERGVILSEDVARHTPEQILDRQRTEFLFAGTRTAERWPMGAAEPIERARPEALRAFYEAWYRPERLCLAIAGDVSVSNVEALVREHFASMVARGEPRPEPASGPAPALQKPEAVCREESRAGLEVVAAFVRAPLDGPKNWRMVERQIAATAGRLMLTRRLQKYTEGGQARLIASVSIDDNAWHRDFRVADLSATCSTDKWPQVVALLEQELRRALEHGFSDEELVFQKEAMRRDMKAAAAGAETLPAAVVAMQLATGLVEDSALVAPDEMLPGMLECIDRLTSETCRQALIECHMASPARWWIAGMASELPEPARIVAVVEESRAQPVAPQAAFVSTPWAYPEAAEPGRVESRVHVADLDIWQARLANGVRVNLKRTPFERGHVRVKVRLGTGLVGEPKDLPGLHLWVGEWVTGGLGRHPYGDFAKMPELVGVSCSASSADDAFVLNAGAQAEQLPFLLRLLAAAISDPGFREEGHLQMDSTIRGFVAPLMDSNDGPLQLMVLPMLASGDKRIGMPWPADIFERTTAELKAWLLPALQSGALEISLVGDLDPEKALDEVARTLGSLPPREPKSLQPALRQLRYLKPPYSHEIKMENFAKDRPARIEFYWPAPGLNDESQRRPLALLTRILEDRLRVKIREEKGAAYAPQSGVMYNEAFDDFVFLGCRLEIPVARVGKTLDEVLSEVRKLAKRGVTPDELERARAQLVAAAQSAQSDNGYWLEAVLADSQERPARLESARTLTTGYAGISKSEIDALAGRILAESNCLRFSFLPAAAVAKTP